MNFTCMKHFVEGPVLICTGLLASSLQTGMPQLNDTLDVLLELILDVVLELCGYPILKPVQEMNSEMNKENKDEMNKEKGTIWALPN